MTVPVSPPPAAIAPAAERVPAKSWGLVLLALAAFLIVPTIPSAFQSIIPITETIVLLAATLAVCSIVGWWRGGNAVLAIIWIGIAVWFLQTPIGQGSQAYQELARGWILFLMASFGIVSLLTPNYGLLSRGLLAVGISSIGAFAMAMTTPGGTAQIRQTMTQEYHRRTEIAVSITRRFTQQPVVQRAIQRNPSLGESIRQNEQELRMWPAKMSGIFLALLALESLAGLALGWALFHRLSAVAIGPSLSKVRDFKFSDQLVWGLAIGGVIVLLPPFEGIRDVGTNLLVFFSALYLLRGIGVLSWVTRGRMMTIALIVLIAVALPIAAALALGVGVGDTWMDWRKRIAPKL